MKFIIGAILICIASLAWADTYQPIELKISPNNHQPVAIQGKEDINLELKYKIQDESEPDRMIASEPDQSEDDTWRNPSSVEDETPPTVKMKETEKLEKWFYEED